jgi:hypothetical protein
VLTSAAQVASQEMPSCSQRSLFLVARRVLPNPFEDIDALD